MAEDLKVDGKVEKGVILLTIHYNQELLLKTEMHKRLSKELTERYREFQDKPEVKTTSCVVKIESEVAGSPVVRALFELWREVVGGKGGQVICIDYPEDYIDSLTSLGLPALNGFSLASTVEEAIQKLTGK